MERQPLTPRKTSILDYIIACQKAGWTPTFREIGKEFGIVSPNGVLYHIKSLEKHGYIKRHFQRARRIDVLKVHEEVAS